MAVNNWRPVLTDHWPMATNSNTKRGSGTPSTATPVLTESWPMATNSGTTVQTTNPFSNLDVYKLQAEGYANQWDNAMAQAYWNIANNLWVYSNFANTSLNNYDALLNYIRWNETGLQNAAWKLYWNLVNDIQSQRDYINQMFWPEGALTKEVNTYYDDLWNYLATDAGRQAANIAAQWMHSWASLWAIRAQQNEAYNEAFWRYIQAKEQQINAKQQIASNLINYMSTLRQEYWDTTNQYIIELYKRANDMYNAIAQSAAADMADYNKYRLAYSWTPTTTSWATSSSLIPWYHHEVINWVNYLVNEKTWEITPSAFGPYKDQVYSTVVRPTTTGSTQNNFYSGRPNANG